VALGVAITGARAKRDDIVIFWIRKQLKMLDEVRKVTKKWLFYSFFQAKDDKTSGYTTHLPSPRGYTTHLPRPRGTQLICQDLGVHDSFAKTSGYTACRIRHC
jgi:hypothetical protein